jgi:hypothetical protein
MSHTNVSLEDFLKSLSGGEYDTARNARRALGQADDIIQDQVSWEAGEAAVAAHFNTRVRKWLSPTERIKYYSSRNKDTGSWNYEEPDVVTFCRSYGQRVTRDQIRAVRAGLKGGKGPRKYTRRAKPVEPPNGHSQQPQSSQNGHKVEPKLVEKVLQSGFGLSDLAPLYKELRQFFEDSVKLV